MRARTVGWVGVTFLALLLVGVISITRVESAPSVTTDKPDY
jgi:hypothetical protein